MFWLIFACSARYMSSTFAPTRRAQSTWSWENSDAEYSTEYQYQDYDTGFPSMTSDFEETVGEFTDNYDYYNVQPKEEVTFTPEPIIPTATEEMPYTMYEL